MPCSFISPMFKFHNFTFVACEMIYDEMLRSQSGDDNHSHFHLRGQYYCLAQFCFSKGQPSEYALVVVQKIALGRLEVFATLRFDNLQ